MSDTDSDILVSCTPPELKSIVNSALSDLIPKKSKRQYEKCYNWCDKQNIKTMSENILLAYLMQQSKVVKSSTLWSIYYTVEVFAEHTRRDRRQKCYFGMRHILD
ncbi:hypothetical protein NQ317_007962 [Molorchus minor]|uniref:Uncharacterized protein n=1 Tax=Molorchus minor TaxID=1323400 RepID=A0ABQ9JAG4_9CUCU|nr:hypothetical protein NQ317_007962 [Molorchus minor]